MEIKEFAKATVFNPGNSVEYSEGAIVSKTVLKKETGNISLFAFEKGQGLSEHTAPFDAMVQIVDGTGEIIIDKKPYQLGKGEIIIMPAGVPHAVNARERFKMMLVMIRG
jgi:quercetin dioxygenase-like cupin family protein